MHWRLYVGIALSALFYCEFLADYIQLVKCSWPLVDDANALHAIILADTHLLGPLRGHWLDKLYREWHMKRAFQAALTLHTPDVVFVLGDLFDEGDFVDNAQFAAYVQRFQSHFRTPNDVLVVSAVGNHDIGFHYKMHPLLTKRFEKHFNNTGIHLYTFKEVHFVFINSMALENDGCHFCKKALKQLNEITSTLDCLKELHTCNDANIRQQHKSYSRPILMQHFPTYRTSDAVCKEHDAIKIENYRERWEVLSKESTDLLGKTLQPRLAFAGHSHHYCLSTNRMHIDEYTVASFSWRNKINPSFLLATFTPREYAVSKCNMLQQQTVYSIYVFTIFACLTLALVHVYQRCVKVKLKQLKNQTSKHL